MRLVALYSCDDNRRRLVLAECLAGLSNRLAAVQRCVLVAGANEVCLLVRGEVGIECYDRLGRGIYQRCGRGGLLRSDNNGIDARVAECGLDHVDLLIIRGSRGRRLDFDVYIVVLAAVSARTGNNLVEVTVRMLYDNGYVVGITGCCGAAVARTVSGCGRTAAASCQHAGTQSTY